MKSVVAYSRFRFLVGTSLAAMFVAGASPAMAQDAADGTTDAEEIIVTGFRQSLEAALNVKRESVSAVDAIVAEDIAKFPDQNLAESLQRIPGIAIQRDGGEGRSITVRGLGPQFTRVRVNGMETVATSADGASANRDRAFDFNVFASELFTSLIVHKTAEPSLDEGSLGAVVDLNTGNPLGGKSGFTVVASAQAQHNTLSKNWGPRFAGLLSWKNDEGTFGAAVSAAYSDSTQLELGNNTVRWQQARFNSVNGTACFSRPFIGGTIVQTADCNAVAVAFHPRIPRYGVVSHDRKRLGLTGSIQWEPTESTKLSIDGLYSRFREFREEKWLEVLFRGGERAIDVSNFRIDATSNNLVSATFNNAYVRTEHYLRKQDTRFYQFSGNLKQDFSDSFRVELLAGFSKSDANIPVETTIMFDDREAQNFRYDYSNPGQPLISFGSSVTDPSNFQLAEIRDRPSNATNKFRTFSLKTEWDVAEGFKIQAGAVYRRFQFNVTEALRDTLVCPVNTAAAQDVVLRTINCTISSGNNAVFGSTAVYGFPVTAALGELADLGNAGQPAGTTSSFLIPNLAAATAFTNLYGRPAVPSATNVRGVIETSKGGFLQFNAKGDLFGMRYAANGGVRYIKTSQISDGLQAQAQLAGAAILVPTRVRRSYEDWLPSFNLALFPTENVILRAAASKVLTRPPLGNLTPGGTVDSFNYRVTFQNPNLDPFRATAYDLAFEWYFAPQSIFSVALFKKNISSFPSTSSRSDTFASTGLPLSILVPGSPAGSDPERQPWTISTVGNGTGASLKGAEITLQSPFKFLPGALSNFGGMLNVAFISSKAPYTVTGAATINPATGALVNPVARVREETLLGLSRRTFNGTLYYEDKKFSARASLSYRSPFLDSTAANGNEFEGYKRSINLDASVKYKLSEQLEFSIEGINLTDDYRERFTDITHQRAYENNHFGRTILFGARFKM